MKAREQRVFLVTVLFLNGTKYLPQFGAIVPVGKVMGDELDPETDRVPALVSVAQAQDPAGVYCGRPPQKGMTSLTCVPLLHSILHFLFIYSPGAAA